MERWYAAYETFDPEALYRSFQGRCEELLIATVGPEFLSAADREALLASAARQQRDPAARSAWVARRTDD